MIELTGMEIGTFLISNRFKNHEDGLCWVFTRVYGPTARSFQETF